MFIAKEILGFASGFFAFLFYAGIMIAIVGGKTRPNKSSWTIWSINDLLIFSSSFALGAWNTLWAPLVYVVCGFICMILSNKHDSGPLSPIDRTCYFGSILAWVLWAVSSSAFVALTLGVIVNTIGAIPTWHKIYRDPKSEHVLPWVFVTVSGLFQILSLERMSLDLSLFPFNSFIIALSILALRVGRYRIFYERPL